MSRVANNPISVPSGITISISGQDVNIKGSKGALDFCLPAMIKVIHEDNELKISTDEKSINANALAGSSRALLNNMVIGVSKGFEQKLELLGVGYRAQVQGNKLNLTLGFSHPVAYDIPQGITIETPTQIEILVKGIDKQLVGEVAAKIRNYRPPEPYKGKGVRYSGELIKLKEVKKK